MIRVLPHELAASASAFRVVGGGIRDALQALDQSAACLGAAMPGTRAPLGYAGMWEAWRRVLVHLSDALEQQSSSLAEAARAYLEADARGAREPVGR